MQELRVASLGWEATLEEGMATHSSILAWRIPWTEEAGRLQSMGFILDSSHPDWRVMVPHCGFDLHFSDNE